jgi:hypothetical protein
MQSDYLDLSRCGFTDAYGLVGIACVAQVAVTETDQFSYPTPKDLDIARYHSRMRLPEVLSHMGMSPGTNHPVRSRAGSKTLAELSAFDNGTQARQIADLVFDRTDGDEDLVEAIWLCLTETCNNVADHSRTSGFAAAQVYDQGSNRERIVLGIGDVGVGLATSLAATVGDLDDTEALSRVLRGGTTGTLDTGRGYGIHDMISTIRELGGLVVIRSGQSIARIDQASSNVKTSSSNLPGTLIGIEIPCAPHRGT